MIVGLDIGSSSVKAVPVDRRGRPRTIVRRVITTRRGPRGRVEHDAGSIARASIDVLRRAVEAGARGIGDRRSGEIPLGVATQRSTVLFWDRDSGRPLTPAYSWQDLRGRALCSRLRAAGVSRRGDAATLIAERTGLRLSPHYAASKIAWAMHHVPGLRRKAETGRALWGTLGTFLVWRMTGGAFYAVDHANAQRTSLFNLDSLSWDLDLFHLFGLEALLQAPVLPALVPTTLSTGAMAPVGRRTLRVLASTGDQQAALLGLGCRRAGDVAINYGSGAFLLQNVGTEPRRAPGLLRTLLSSRRSERPPGSVTARYAVEGTVNSAATAIDWVQRRLRIRIRTADLDGFLGPGDAGPRRLHFLPAVAGTGAPRWDEGARPRFAGEVAGAGPRELLRAVVESIAFRCAEIARAAGIARRRDDPVLVAGGLTRCRVLLQMQADLLGRPLLVLPSPDATALGAAMLARDAAEGPDHAAGREERRGRSADSRGAGLIVRPEISRDEAESRLRAWARAVYRQDPERPSRPSRF